jgi:hypothetical protein
MDSERNQGAGTSYPSCRTGVAVIDGRLFTVPRAQFMSQGSLLMFHG